MKSILGTFAVWLLFREWKKYKRKLDDEAYMETLRAEMHKAERLRMEIFEAERLRRQRQPIARA